MKSLQVHYEGHVQGVGFRFTVRRIATGFDVSGSVRNLPDGRVELHAWGESPEIDAFLQAIRDSSLRGHIRHEEIRERPPDPAVRGFFIAH
jgi:acylphosphatase